MTGTLDFTEHRGPPPGLLATLFAILFNLGLWFVISFSASQPHFPGPWESTPTLLAYFRGHPGDVLRCALFQFGSAVPLGLFTATVVSRMQFLGVRVAGPWLALFGGLATSFNLALSAMILWVMAYPGIAQDGGVLRALYYLTFAIGGVGYSVPLGLLIAGLAVPSIVLRLVPRWLAWSGIGIALVGELSWFSMILPKALFLIPLTRFPGFVWLIAFGLLLPKSRPAHDASSQS